MEPLAAEIRQKPSIKRTKTRLREYRLRAGLTQEELAAKLDIKQENICKAELTGNGIGQSTWYRLADMFDIDPRILKGLKDP